MLTIYLLDQKADTDKTSRFKGWRQVTVGDWLEILEYSSRFAAEVVWQLTSSRPPPAAAAAAAAAAHCSFVTGFTVMSFTASAVSVQTSPLSSRRTVAMHQIPHTHLRCET
ncbi:hypothetical protein JOB18_039896 [Solea senegalensis]|uniref:Uncharacterized protein n=1 Tax=Solea senegalensis TaxID=28829 RepID=A0AAV6SNJ8_SOLSE|nr:hypothetical protein JOB18_039896 [Solea senegalensis]